MATFATLEGMKEKGIFLNLHTYNTLIGGLLGENRPDEAFEKIGLRSLNIKEALEHKSSLKTLLLRLVLTGTPMVIWDDILTPTISVISAVTDLQGAIKMLGTGPKEAPDITTMVSLWNCSAYSGLGQELKQCLQILPSLCAINAGKEVAKFFCAKYFHKQVINHEAYAAGEIGTSVQKAFFRL
ncbi:OLC1v1030403C1 [Oldenlandia corymbosa var. corymbosa]|uniref:OLC1v1030403C1 n=1 Tax=Oldenlandia corymbosa var. corymbosa TaxID=529605 RepID=A0AAV1CHY8_OLDCO|nr:OLC1v1030403C1 [Oldenlandia corymbosa var. corymbosa]